ncbi:endoribonuclease YbeY isoform X1 [Equus asinus]|uniref:endoribonuclease YbeY isoform X1 n=1 Tax=Equus asinus TaxID=9793 RepID=UPI0038F802B4
MSLVLRNLQRAIPLRRVPLRKKIEIVRNILGVQKFDLGIICVDNKNIQHINRIYREKNIPTDVLSFPFHENLKAGEIPQPDFPDDYNLGDIFLGVEYIFQQCKENEDYYDILTVSGNTEMTEPDSEIKTSVLHPGHEEVTDVTPASTLSSTCRTRVVEGSTPLIIPRRESREPAAWGLQAGGSVGRGPSPLLGPCDCHTWALSLAGVHTQHGGRMAEDVPEGEAGSRGAEPAHRDQAPAPEQGPLLMAMVPAGYSRTQGRRVGGRWTPPFELRESGTPPN